MNTVPPTPPTSAAAPLLDVRGLSVDFHGRRGPLRALDGVSFSLAPGEILGVVGESGAGKSLTGAALLGLLPPPGRVASGGIWLNGQRLDTLQGEALRRIRGRQIGAVFQDPLTALNPLFTVGDQLTETLRTHLPLSQAQARARALDLLRQTGLPAPEQRLAQYPHELSGGMRQRVVIALALAAEPCLIVADEPTTALDVSVQAQVIGLLRDAARARGAAVLLITHDMGVIAEACDRVAVMYAGRMVEIGPVRSVLTRPAHPYTQGLMAAIPRMDEAADGEDLRQIEGAMPRLDALPSGCAFHPRCRLAGPDCAARRPEWSVQPGGGFACWHPVGEAQA